METGKLVVEVICSLCLLIAILMLVWKQEKHRKKIIRLENEVEYLKIENKDHGLLIKVLQDKVGVNKKSGPQGPEGPLIEHSPNLGNEVKRNEKE